MSHIVNIKTEVRDEHAVRAACLRLKWEQPTFGVHQVYAIKETGLAVKAPGWSYPIVCNLQTGGVAYDNFNGHWGEQSRLNEFLQAYSVEKAKLEAAKNGYSVYEESMADGSIKLSVTVEA